MDKQDHQNEWYDEEFAEEMELHNFKGNAFSGSVNAVADEDGDSARFVVDDYSSKEEYASEDEFAETGMMAGMGTMGAITSLPDRAVDATGMDASDNGAANPAGRTSDAATTNVAVTEASEEQNAGSTSMSASQERSFDVDAAKNAQNSSAIRMTDYKTNDEEYASEVATAPRGMIQPEEDRPDESRQVKASQPMQTAKAGAGAGAGLGWTAMILALVSLFILPSILGPAAVVLGAFAYARGRKGLGAWSVVIGLISFVSYVLLAPMFS